MISESQQEQATLYALELLDADGAAAFERQIAADPELRELVRDLQETAALLALAGEESSVAAPPALRDRVLAEVTMGRTTRRDQNIRKTGNKRIAFLPWAIAALLLGCSGGAFWLAQNRQARLRYVESKLKQAKPPSADSSLAQISFCALDPTPDFLTAQPRAAVLWDAAHRQGKLRVNRLAPPADGKDYQLWTVEAGRKEPVSAGVIHVNADGKADLPFQPVDADGKPVVAVAISLERAGGSPTNQGPILLLGKF